MGYTVQAGDVEVGGSEIAVDTSGNVGGSTQPYTGNELCVYLNDTLIDTRIGAIAEGGGAEPLDYYFNVGTADVATRSTSPIWRTMNKLETLAGGSRE